MITEKQKQNVRQMSKEDLLVLLDICTDVLGVVSHKKYMELTGIKRSTMYYFIDTEKIKSFKISGHKFPLINY